MFTSRMTSTAIAITAVMTANVISWYMAWMNAVWGLGLPEDYVALADTR